MKNKYCESIVSYQRRVSRKVNIGNVPLGGNEPIRIQSMTTVDTMDTEGSIAQSIRMIEAGCEYVRITAPSIKEAQNLENIKAGLRKRGYLTPLVADIHFTPNAAELAASIVEKVRVNPGNYADKKKFETIEYTDESYQVEIDRIRHKFAPLVEICKANGTAIRIGTNHGSLSDRIMSRYGDTPLGMVESALEFIRICEDMDFYDLVVSMKASNPQIMVQAYRLLVNRLDLEGLQPYPLHLGVTEAGEAEDGRIKSAVGIGTLLEDGLGDTVRVSLTEEPEAEAPVARYLVDRLKDRHGHAAIEPLDEIPVNPFNFRKRETREVINFGYENVPRVITDFSQLPLMGRKDLKAIGHSYLPELDKWGMNDFGADYIYTGQRPVNFMLPNGLKEILAYDAWVKGEIPEAYPMMNWQQWQTGKCHKSLNFLTLDATNLSTINDLKGADNLVVLLSTSNRHAMAAMRRFIFELIIQKVSVPVVLQRPAVDYIEDELLLHTSTDMGGLLIDGMGDGVMLTGAQNLSQAKFHNETLFGILQAARTRITKTEYISCPSCGRTLFDLQETTAMIRKRTDHLKGVKIGIMGCIVNGPGEMADADYGYVGSGKGKITLYRGQEVMKRGVPSERALDELIELIKADGRWIDTRSEEMV